jgi:hypothetical protein
VGDGERGEGEQCSNSDGKNDPARNFKIRNSKSPAGVVNVHGRWPLRSAVRVSLRSCGATLITTPSGLTTYTITWDATHANYRALHYPQRC